MLLVYATVTATSTTNIAEQLFLEFQDVQEKNKKILAAVTVVMASSLS